MLLVHILSPFSMKFIAIGIITLSITLLHLLIFYASAYLFPSLIYLAFLLPSSSSYYWVVITLIILLIIHGTVLCVHYVWKKFQCRSIIKYIYLFSNKEEKLLIGLSIPIWILLTILSCFFLFGGELDGSVDIYSRRFFLICNILFCFFVRCFITIVGILMLWINKKYHLMQDEILKILTWGRIASSILIVSPLIVPIAWIASKIGLHRYQYIEHRMFFYLGDCFYFLDNVFLIWSFDHLW